MARIKLRSSALLLLRRALERQPGRVATFAIGTGMIAASFIAPNGGDPFATMVLWLGAALTVMAGLTPWIAQLTVGPQGFSFTGRDVPAESTYVSTEEDDVPEPTREARVEVVVERARVLAADAAFSSLLRPAVGVLAGIGFDLYLWDDDEERLMPIFEGDGGDIGWELGKGATGEAFDRGEYVRVVGPDVHNDVHGLTQQQQERYRHLQVVAAAPVLNAAGEPIAVVSAGVEKEDSPLGTEQGYLEHLSMAAAVSRVLIDLLKWEED